MADDVSWTSSVRNKKTLTINTSAVSGPAWTTAVTAAIKELNDLFVANSVNVTLKAAESAVVEVALSSGTYTFKVEGKPRKGSLRTDILHGTTRSIDRILGSTPEREYAYIFLPRDPKVSPGNPRSRNVGEPVMRVIAAHEFLHALGLDDHDRGIEGLHAGSWTLNEGVKPEDDTVSPFGSKTKLPPLVLSADTLKRLKKVWP